MPEVKNSQESQEGQGAIAPPKIVFVVQQRGVHRGVTHWIDLQPIHGILYDALSHRSLILSFGNYEHAFRLVKRTISEEIMFPQSPKEPEESINEG